MVFDFLNSSKLYCSFDNSQIKRIASQKSMGAPLIAALQYGMITPYQTPTPLAKITKSPMDTMKLRTGNRSEISFLTSSAQISYSSSLSVFLIFLSPNLRALPYIINFSSCFASRSMESAITELCTYVP